MSQDLMLDLETLDTGPTSVVLTFGAVKFDKFSEKDPDDSSAIYLRLDMDEQSALGRTINPDTIEWWGKQSKESQEEAFSEENRISLEDFTTQLNKYIVGVNDIYAHGTTFDIVILENLYRMLGKPIPWNYWQIRDSRTLFSLIGDPRPKNNLDAHNALADAYHQARGVQQVFKELGMLGVNRKNI